MMTFQTYAWREVELSSVGRPSIGLATLVRYIWGLHGVGFAFFWREVNYTPSVCRGLFAHKYFLHQLITET